MKASISKYLARHRVLGSFIAILVASVSANHADAAVLVSNLSGANNASASPQSTFWLAQAFTTDATSYTLDSVALQGANSSTGSQVFLYSDSGQLPSVELASFSTAGFGTTSGTYTLPANGTVTLNGSTTYWIVFAPNDANFGLWTRTTAAGNQEGPGLIPDLQAFSTNGGSSFSSTDIDEYLKLEINVSPIPEPSITACAALMAGILLGRRRR